MYYILENQMVLAFNCEHNPIRYLFVSLVSLMVLVDIILFVLSHLYSLYI